METSGETLFQIIFLAIWIALILAHSWGFWRVYKQPTENANSSDMMWRGAVAGSTAWFWLCFVITFWNWNSGGLMMTVWLYGLLFVPLSGVFFTVLFWKVKSRLELNLGVFSRALFGLMIGIIIGLIASVFIYSPKNPESGFVVGQIIFMTAAIASTAAIMTGEKRLN